MRRDGESPLPPPLGQVDPRWACARADDRACVRVRLAVRAWAWARVRVCVCVEQSMNASITAVLRQWSML